MAINTKLVQTPTVSLYSGMSSAATTARITPFPVDLDGNKLSMTDFGSIGYFTVDPTIKNFEEINSFTGLTDNGDNTGTLTGLTRDLTSKYPYTAAGTGKIHGASAVVVFSDCPQVYSRYAAKDNDETITGQWTFNVFPITPATPLATNLVAGFTKLSVAAAVAANPIAVGDNDIRVPPTNPDIRYSLAAAGIFSGFETWSKLKTVPSGWYEENGQAVTRGGANAALFAAVMPSQTFTVTIASPAVFTASSHGYVAGDQVSFTTTGGLPSGIAVNTAYFVIGAGLATNTFEISATLGGAAINTTGSQSGTHTTYWSNHGIGDGSTTFTLPDMRGYGPMGLKTSDTNFDVIGSPTVYVGEKTHVLTVGELASHSHSITNFATNAGSGSGGTGAATNNWSAPIIGSAGSDNPHNNMHPYKVGRWLIKI